MDEQDRIRPHIRFIVREEFVHTLAHPLALGDEAQIICALSGGSSGSQGMAGGNDAGRGTRASHFPDCSRNDSSYLPIIFL